MSSQTAVPASLPPKICAPPERPRNGHDALTTDVLAELVVSESRGRSVGTRDFLFDRNRTRKLMTTLQVNEPLTAATALKAEREREKAQAVRAARLSTNGPKAKRCSSVGIYLTCDRAPLQRYPKPNMRAAGRKRSHQWSFLRFLTSSIGPEPDVSRTIRQRFQAGLFRKG